jgi:hypothetical protein
LDATGGSEALVKLPPVDAIETQLVTLAADLESRRLDVEENLLGCILSKPGEGTRLATACGVTSAMFDDEGHRLIFDAAAFATDRPLTAIVRLALDALAHYEIPGWTAERLCGIATSWPGPAATPALMATLVTLQARQRQALTLMRLVREALAGEGMAA